MVLAEWMIGYEIIKILAKLQGNFPAKTAKAETTDTPGATFFSTSLINWLLGETKLICCFTGQASQKSGSVGKKIKTKVRF